MILHTSIESNERKPCIIIPGDARKQLKTIPDESVQSCITSPPYWGTRDYGVNNQIGAEESLEEYIKNLQKVFKEIHRILKINGTLWLNLGDTYTSGNRGWRAPDRKNPSRSMGYRPPTPTGLKPKDLVGLPWHVAFALQKDGWYLRSDIIWNKPNAQPESVKDRPTRSHEYLFLFSKSSVYFYDYESSQENSNGGNNKRNRRSVWSIYTEGKHPPHLAVFPPELVKICLLTSSKRGDTIIDPFMGSGTVGLVCIENKRNFIGIEIKPEYVKIASDRIGVDNGEKAE
ncbi:MAG: site-specific DNA-methyltransferase [Dehalococcoidales bacterium]|nr:site-specific DNA-methyltransferase [Dehalococcoidales bacterium]